MKKLIGIVLAIVTLLLTQRVMLTLSFTPPVPVLQPPAMRGVYAKKYGLLSPPHRIAPMPPRRRQASCTDSAAATVSGIDNAIYGEVMSGIRQNGDVVCIADNSGTPIDLTGGGFVMLATGPGGDIAYELRGAGGFVGTCPNIATTCGAAGNTVIRNREGSPGQQMIQMNESTAGSLTVSNIRWVFDASSTRPSTTNDFNIIVDTVSGGKPTIWHHNDFALDAQNDCQSPKWFSVNTKHILIYSNDFTNVPIASCGYGNTNQDAMFISTSTGNVAYWDSTSTMGSADTTGENNVYVENNSFTGYNVAADRQTAARTVWRFNAMHGSSTADHGFDSSTLGERHSEFYNNTWYCDTVINLNTYTSTRGGTGMYFNNFFPAANPSFCDFSGDGLNSIFITQYKLTQCDAIPGWPGSYPGTYPVSHQVGWGWFMSNTNTGVGNDANQRQPGSEQVPGLDGFDQSKEPIYFFANTDNNGGMPGVANQGVPNCKAMTYSGTGKTLGTTLDTFPSYANTGQAMMVVMVDLVGGSTPTITDTKSNTWTQQETQTNGSMRMTMWTAVANADGALTVRATFGSSSAARALSLIVMRNMTASPVDQHPDIIVDNSSPYDGPATTNPLGQTNELVVGYFGLNGPTTLSGASSINDNIDPGSGWVQAFAWQRQASLSGIFGTSGGAADTNVSMGIVYQVVNANTAVQPQLVNATGNRLGLAGTITFKCASSPCDLDLHVTDFIQPDSEYYNQASGVQTSATSPFNGTTGAGWGTRARRPTTCTTGVAYWSTDQGSWNHSGSGGQGVLDKCTATNTWTDDFYHPYDYPHTLASSTNFLEFTTQPTDIASGGTFSPTVVATVRLPNGTTDTSATGDVTVAPTGCAATLTGTLVRAAVMGVATFTGLGATIGASNPCNMTAAYTGATTAVSNSFNVNTASSPTFTKIFPNISVRGQTFPVTLTGTNFNTGNAVIGVSGAGMSCGSVVVGSATSITASCTIIGSAATSIRSLTVTTDTGISGSIPFTILTQGLGVRPR